MSTTVRRVLQLQLDQHNAATRKRLDDKLRSYGLASLIGSVATAQYTLSALVRVSDMSLVSLVRLVRGESADDPRPNKALSPSVYRQLLVGYPHQDLMIKIALEGFAAAWGPVVDRRSPLPHNHRSALVHMDGVEDRIREGEKAGTYLVLDEDIILGWDVHVSPFGAVPKSDSADATAIRLIHDLAFPLNGSVNSYTLQESIPKIPYESVVALASRIEHVVEAFPHAQVLVLKGDVQGAFRHLRQRAEDVRWMGGRLPRCAAGVVDLSAPFGWTGSPGFYGVFGRAISTILGRESPASMAEGEQDMTPFFAYEWVDDHILVEPDIGQRCVIAEDTLRLAMLAVLGPQAINESKFTPWGTRTTALGLAWDTVARTVSIPASKIVKALGRVTSALSVRRLSSTDLHKLLGSLRHVATCCRAARPFYQRLQVVCSALPRYGSTPVTPWMADDLAWFSSILRSGSLEGIPTRLFGSLPRPDIHLYTDASGEGLCVLDPASRRYILLAFDAAERSDDQFDINVREQFAIALACMTLGSSWYSMYAPSWPHVRFWCDNQAAVTRTRKLSARHPYAQELNRCIGFAEATWRIHTSTQHLPGSWNVMADAGSRWSVDRHRRCFADFVDEWTQVLIPAQLRRIYATFSTHFKPRHWQPAPDGSTNALGSNGVDGANGVARNPNSHARSSDTRPDSSNFPSPAGSVRQPATRTPHPPFCPSVAISHGIIKFDSATPSGLPTATDSLCSGCDGCLPLLGGEHPPLSASSACSGPASTSTSPKTAFSGGLRSWASSLCCDDRSTLV